MTQPNRSAADVGNRIVRISKLCKSRDVVYGGAVSAELVLVVVAAVL